MRGGRNPYRVGISISEGLANNVNCTTCSAIVWLVTLIGASILWRAFLPGATWVFLPMLVTSVGVQEVVRPLIWKYYL